MQSKIKYGVILGLVQAASGLLLYILGAEAMLKVSWLDYVFGFGGICLTLYFGIRLRRKQGGYFTYGQAFGNLMTLSTIEVGLNMIIMLLLYQVIDPDFGEAVAAELARQAAGFSENQVQATMAVLVYSNPAALTGVFVSAITGLLGSVFLNLILALIVREEPITVRG